MERDLPACCHPSEGADLAEQFYCAYMRGGAPERAGLAWDGRPCPTWAELHERSAGNDGAAQGVIDKWEAVVEAMEPKLVPPGLDLRDLVLRAYILDVLLLNQQHVEGRGGSEKEMLEEMTALLQHLADAGAMQDMPRLGSLRLQRMLRAVQPQEAEDA